MNDRKQTIGLTTTALMAAIIFIVTFVVRVPLPGSGGYLNLGDTALYMAAYLLGGPAGAIAGAIGAAMADLAVGAVSYALPTAVIKGAMGLVCGSLMRRGNFKRFILAAVLGGAIMTGGYAVFEALFFNVNQALAGILWNLIQWGGCVGAAAALYPAANVIAKTLRKK